MKTLRLQIFATAAAAWTADTRQDGCMLSCRLHHKFVSSLNINIVCDMQTHLLTHLTQQQFKVWRAILFTHWVIQPTSYCKFSQDILLSKVRKTTCLCDKNTPTLCVYEMQLICQFKHKSFILHFVVFIQYSCIKLQRGQEKLRCRQRQVTRTAGGLHFWDKTGKTRLMWQAVF